ncbi:hypothetical protein CA13_06960 [Planctomycetes bacterium CA13]|uniref:Uncharacterized protein n=1 Tax=Novipirellula herctigrandis TaxID=2527986 RepID=A0A5C5YXL0_9BACT|nr:hypothetical protein CA13_06960 [Planctomycetes bacterium CA13]
MLGLDNLEELCRFDRLEPLHGVVCGFLVDEARVQFRKCPAGEGKLLGGSLAVRGLLIASFFATFDEICMDFILRVQTPEFWFL